VYVVIPANKEGAKSILIFNPDKSVAILDDVLTYLDDPDIAEEFRQKEEKGHLL
jgi:hypothetical protein